MNPGRAIVRGLLVLWVLLFLPMATQAGGPPGSRRGPLPEPSSATIRGHVEALNRSITQEVTDWNDPLCVGWRQRYTLSVANHGMITLTGVQMIDRLPQVALTVLLDNSSPGALYDGGSEVVWEIETLAPGQTATRYLEIRIWSSVPAGIVISNCLSIASNQMSTAWVCAESLVIDCAGPSPTASRTPTGTPILEHTPTVTPTPTGPVPPTRELPSLTPTDTPTVTPTPNETIMSRRLTLPLVLKAHTNSEPPSSVR